MNETCDDNKTNESVKKADSKWRIEWRNATPMIVLHLAIPYLIKLIFTEAKWQTNLFAYLLYRMSLVGITAGAHRLWSHRAYKANAPLQTILLILSSIAFQGSAYRWAVDHRVHHKYTDTNADPHNSSRGFFFSHIGWILLKKNKEVREKRLTIDADDLKANKLLQFQHKYYMWLANFFCFLLPTFIPKLWGENLWTAFCVAGCFRVLFSSHAFYLINSVAHMWGAKPYDRDMKPTESKIVSFLATGEGFHNFHHTFPQDYRAGELGGYKLNIARLFIDIMAKIGWAYDLRTVSEEMIEKRVNRTGDGSHPVFGHIRPSFEIRQKGS
ncbi:acyl-CoA Delta-9 desaturase-like [Anticarsia gemmatalis]|uniref:acyl-CoA Delta-9 desaturase-like n=1 Tax=Anticarsia gemmatalis TaxID=129554 RepID=UPI003F75CD70